jgi:hypothetical protein
MRSEELESRTNCLLRKIRTQAMRRCLESLNPDHGLEEEGHLKRVSIPKDKYEISLNVT